VTNVDVYLATYVIIIQYLVWHIRQQNRTEQNTAEYLYFV